VSAIPKAGVDLFWSFLSVGHTETTRSVVYLVEVAAALSLLLPLPAALTLLLSLLTALAPLLATTATTTTSHQLLGSRYRVCHFLYVASILF
jgi:hypothetical protein